MKSKTHVLIELLGWVGVVSILLAYALLSFDVITSHDLSFQLLNMIGAIGIISVSMMKKTYQPAFLNLIWLFIALFAVSKIIINATS